MTNTWFISDTHFGHEGTASYFKRPDGTPLRPFKNADHQDEVLIKNWNAVVKPEDRVYHLGDFCMRRAKLDVLHRLNGRIAFVLGNHDPWDLGTWRKYPNVTHLLGYKVYPEHGLICSHVPISLMQLQSRFKFNAHGHMHDRTMDDPRYINVCVEHTNYTPISFDELLSRMNG